jgi:predicted signal transduction protein with EAL and GGDEF domain
VLSVVYIRVLGQWAIASSFICSYAPLYLALLTPPMLLFVFAFVCTTQLQQMLQQRHAARDAERAALAAEDEKRRKAALYLG